MAQRNAAARYPDWFSVPEGRLETYPHRFPGLTKFDDFRIITSKRGMSTPYEQFVRVGVDIMDYPGFGNPAFFDYRANPDSWYEIPSGAAWRDYVQSQISAGVIGSLADLSAPTLTAGATQVINYLADNLENIDNRIMLDQRQESGFDDTSVAYLRVAQRIAQRISQRVASGNLPYRPIYAGGYIFFANSDRFFWQYDLNSSVVNKSRPLRHETFYVGEGWKQYNPFYGQERYTFMDSNAGTYWQGPNYTDGVYETLNGLFVRQYARTQMPAAARNQTRHIMFVWDKCDNQRGSFSFSQEYITTSPPGRLKLRKRLNPPVEWLRLSGWLAAVMCDGYAVWNDPTLIVADENYVTNDIDNPNLSDRFYPAGSTTAQAWPRTLNPGQTQAGTATAEGYIDWGILGVRQGYEVRRALGGKCVTATFLPFSLDGGPVVQPRPNGSDILYATVEKRGVIMQFTGANGKKCDAYYTPFGDFVPHTLTYTNGGQTDTMTVHGNGLTYTNPY